MDFHPSDSNGAQGGQTEPVRLHEITRSRYLNYALSVITSRALPDVRDGLKPVQRRILYAMYKDLKLRADSRYLKSARVVGDVMGKYHPHGDSSIYDAMVRMAQSFSLRYPLVDGQGNFGSIDGDGAAAMRYTEARLQAIAQELLAEINQNTVHFRPTYDGQQEEPIVLPAQLPNLLINGATGIAVGMATNIPPHNLKEVIDACGLLIAQPQLREADVVEATRALCQHVRAPDFPTGGEIISSADEILQAYVTGQGPIRAQGTYTVETHQRKNYVVITSLPYTQNKASLVERIAGLIEGKKLPQLVDIRDESTDDVRIVMELKRDARAEVAMAYIYKHTPLQQNFNLNLTCLIPTDNPQVSAPARIGLRDLLVHFLDFRLDVVRRRLQHQLELLDRRIHILEGFELVFDALDELIALIRKSKGKADAAKKIRKRFGLDEIQTEAILELKLYRLAQLEILLIREELAEKRAQAAKIRAQLAHEQALWHIVRDELLELSSAYGDERRTLIVGPSEPMDFGEEHYIVREKAWVFVTRQGRIKRQKGFSELSAVRVPDGDEVGWVVRTDTRQTIAIYTQLGSAYVLRVDDITATTGHGDPVQAIFSFADGERIVGVTGSDPRLYPAPTQPPEPSQGQLALPEEVAATPDEPGPPYAVALTRTGKCSRWPIQMHAEPSNKAGRRYMSLVADDEVVAVLPSTGEEQVCLATQLARVLVFPVAEIPAKASAVRGVNAIRLDAKDALLGWCLSLKKREGLVTKTNRGREVVVRETSYPSTRRGGKGRAVLQLGRLTEVQRDVQIQRPIQADEESTEEPS